MRADADLVHRIMYRLLVALVRLAVRSRRSKDLEIIVLRHQLGVLRRQVDRPELTDADRSLLGAIAAALPRPSRAGWLVTPTRCCVGTGAASSGTGPNHSDHRADRRPQQSFADSHCVSQLRIRLGATAASTANLPGSATASLRPRSGRSSTTPESTRTHSLRSHLVAVPTVPGRRRLRLRHHRNRHAAQVLPAVLHRHRDPDRVLRRDHGPPHRRLDHPSGAEPVAPTRPPTRRRPGARARPRQPVHRRLRRDLQNRTHEDPQDTCAHSRGERVRRTLDRHPVSMASGICPVADSRTAQPWPTELPGGGQVFCPLG